MQAVVFRDRCGRVIRIIFDESGTCAVAHHEEEAVGELRLHTVGTAEDAARRGMPVVLDSLFVEPAYRRAGIAHTLLSSACREFGRPIRVDPDARPDSPAWATLCRCLALEGVVVVE